MCPAFRFPDTRSPISEYLVKSTFYCNQGVVVGTWHRTCMHKNGIRKPMGKTESFAEGKEYLMRLPVVQMVNKRRAW